MSCQPIHRHFMLNEHSYSEIYDTYFSPSLNTMYPPGRATYFPGQGDFWNGARPGTFSIKYDPVLNTDDTIDDTHTLYMLIYLGH
jgi:hypothetical protein